MKQRSLILTGATGFLGYSLIQELSPSFRIIAGIHVRQPRYPVSETVAVDLEGDLPDLDRLCAASTKAGSPPIILHAAAVSTVRECEENPILARTVNSDGTARLAAIAARYECPLFVISTDLVYGAGRPPFSESEAMATSVYSRSKLEAEVAAQSIHPASIVLRCALMIGPDTPSAPSHIRKMDRSIRQGTALHLFFDEFRTPVWTPDIARVVLRSIELGITGRIYNVGGPDRISRYDLGLRAARLLGWPPERLVPVSSDSVAQPGPRPKDCSLDISRLKVELGLDMTPVDAGLQMLARDWKRDV